MTDSPLGASFRDPSGFMYAADGELYRQVNRSYAAHFDALVRSGLYEALVGRGWLVRHEDVDRPAGPDAYRTLRPERIPYVSYPYEWCFSQLRDAALLTLEIQRVSLEHGMGLKDASAFNVQFIGSRPIFIDTLSFEVYRDGAPWVAYRQFCQHFLGPLALMARLDGRTRHLLRHYIDGLPLDLVSRMLPASSRLRYGLLAHLHLHASSQRRHQDDARTGAVEIPTLPKSRLLALIESLRATVRGCAPPARPTEWGGYYEDTNYSADSMRAKEALVQGMLDEVAAPTDLVHDLGANTGRFSRVATSSARHVVAHDIDDAAVEAHYLRNQADGTDRILPLLLDLTSPSPALGWALDERQSFIDRASGSAVLALALVHHLAITNNVPLPLVAAFFGRLAKGLVIEFVPKEDSQVRRLLATREDVFPDYTREAFTAAFSNPFEIVRVADVPGTSRTLYAMRRR